MPGEGSSLRLDVACKAHSLPSLGLIAVSSGKPEFTNCRSDLSMHLREHVLGGRIQVLGLIGLIGARLGGWLRLLPVLVPAPAFAWPPVWR